MNLQFTINPTLNLKRPTKANPAPLVAVFCDNQGKVLGNIDSKLSEQATKLIKAAHFKGTLGEAIHHYGDEAMVVVGVGSIKKLAQNIAKVAKATHKAIKNSQHAAIVWGDVICQKHFGQFVLAIGASHYCFDNYKSDKTPPTLTQVSFVNNKDEPSDYETALAFAQAVLAGQNLARDVANEPPNVCTPSYLAKLAKQLGKEYSDSVNVQILDEKELQSLGMGAFLAVAQGSNEEGKIAVIEYFGKSKKSKKAKLDAPIALVGKGITFDTGGISLKPAANMDEMKFDMGGAAAMLGVAHSLCHAQLPIDVVIILALAENMPSGKASRPGDVVYAMNGTSIEILNTDAEGRLVLCDALCYAQDSYQPSVIIDAATLTGACVVALGSQRSGLYSNDEDTLFALESASEYSGDLVWHMPLGDDYAEQLKSSVADVQNIGGPKGGSVTAACFLQKFIKDGQAWAHLDIAGTAWVGGDNKGATARPVPLLMHYLRQKAQG